MGAQKTIGFTRLFLLLEGSHCGRLEEFAVGIHIGMARCARMGIRRRGRIELIDEFEYAEQQVVSGIHDSYPPFGERE